MNVFNIVPKLHSFLKTYVTIYVNDTIIASGSSSTNYVYIWDIIQGTKIKNLAHKKVTSLLLMKNGFLLSGDVNAETKIKIWKTSDFNKYKVSTMRDKS